MSEGEAKKCSKCGSTAFEEKTLKLPGSREMLNAVTATAYICEKCSYVELYGKRSRTRGN